MLKMPVGLYEKALPPELSWEERLAAAGKAGYDFIDISIDESDERLSRLDWSASERATLRQAIANTGVQVSTMCLSAHRKYPFGSKDPEQCFLTFRLEGVEEDELVSALKPEVLEVTHVCCAA